MNSQASLKRQSVSGAMLIGRRICRRHSRQDVRLQSVLCKIAHSLINSFSESEGLQTFVRSFAVLQSKEVPVGQGMKYI